MQYLGCPTLCTVRLCRRWSSESPRISHPSAVPIGRSSGCPAFRSFGIADDPFHRLPRFADLPAPSGGLPGCSGPITLRFCHWLDLQVAPNLSPLAGPVARFASCPASLRFWPRRRTNFQVSLNLGSFGVALVPIGRLPRLSSPRLRCCFPGVSSASATAAGSTMNPWPVSNFASSVRAADESSRPIRSNFSPLTLHALSIFAPLSAVGRLQIAELNRSRASCQVGSAVHFPTGSPTD